MNHLATWSIAFLSIAGVIIRPFKVPEAVWAIGGVILLLLCGLLSPQDGLTGIGRGTDVYLFLTGMMLLAETAREEKLFDWLAAHVTNMAKGSSNRLFLLMYITGTLVTVFLSNDATAVVLTPAVIAATKAAKIKKPLPYLLICAFVANAASFVLPISNAANLVIYGSHMPPLQQWLQLYSLPSVCAIMVTYIMLYLMQRNNIRQTIETRIEIPTLKNGGRTALWGIGATAIILLIASALDLQLGLPTAITGILTTTIVLLAAKKSPQIILQGVTWSVLLLVAGLFVIVEALNKTGLIEMLSSILQQGISRSITATVWGSGFIVAFACNLVNNLPAGLIAGHVVQSGEVPATIKSAILIGTDLGPNLSVTGSLATILWLVALQREGINVTAWNFLKTGLLVMTLALLFAIGALWL